MKKSILDTDILSEVFKGKTPTVSAAARAYLAEHGFLTISAITVMESVKGYQRIGREGDIRNFLTTIVDVEVLAIDAPIGVLAGRIQGDLERTGQTIGRSDPIIAAVAIKHGLTLVTGNTDHFRRIQALGYPLALDDWRRE